MKIRKDFEPVASFIEQLAELGNLFRENDQYWSDLKKGDDYREVYLLPWDNNVRTLIETMYSDGRDCARCMESKLQSFNDFSQYPTLSSYIDSFESTWVDSIAGMQSVLDNALTSANTLKNLPWVVREMLHLFKALLNLLTVVKNTLADIKQTDIYKLQKGNTGASVSSPSLKITSDVVEQVIDDIEILLQSNRAISGVDRIHTALHGYLKAVCEDANITYQQNAKPTITALFKILRNDHPKLNNLGTQSKEIFQILQAFSNAMDAFNSIRNDGSVAHPNDNLLDKDEALFFINSARTILHYLDAKISNDSKTQ